MGSRRALFGWGEGPYPRPEALRESGKRENEDRKMKEKGEKEGRKTSEGERGREGERKKEEGKKVK